MPRVSVVIPTHNRASLLLRSVASAQAAGDDVEVIVVDDASTDNTAELCADLAGVRYIRLDRNLGLAGARNVGILHCSAEYISFLDDDDLRVPGSLDRQIDALEREPEAGFAYGQYVMADNVTCEPTGTPKPEQCPAGDLFWQFLEANLIAVHCAVVRKSALAAVGLFDRNFPGVEDWHLWLRLTEKFPVVATPELVAIYRQGVTGSGQMSSNWARLTRVGKQVQDWAMQLPRVREASAAQRRQARRKFRDVYSDLLIWSAADALKAGDHERARDSLVLALQLNPLRSARPRTFRLLSQTLRPGARLQPAAAPK